MINIFNLFLFLYSFWLVLLFLKDGFSVFFLILGIFICFLVSIFARKIKIINKDFNLLFLSFGFYRHFFIIYFISCYKYLILLPKLVFSQKINQDCLFYIKIKKKLTKQEFALFIATINLIPGISYVDKKGGDIIIYSTIKELFNKVDIVKIYNNIHRINDDSLV